MAVFRDEYRREHLPNNIFTIEPLAGKDIDKLKPILEAHVRDDETRESIQAEIDEIQAYMHGGKDRFGRIRKYFVARDDKQNILGCVAITEPEPIMLSHFSTTPDESMELVNAFVSDSVFRGGGVGKALFNTACNFAKEKGKKQIILNSGPRYKKSWGFYDRVYDQNRGFLIDHYGKGRSAKTWAKVLK